MLAVPVVDVTVYGCSPLAVRLGAVSNLLAPVEHTTPVRFKDSTWRWVDVKQFRLGGQGSDRDLLDALITHPRYRDHYTSPNSDTRDPIHGPYELNRIRVDMFTPFTETEAIDALREWTTEFDYPEGCDASWPWNIAPPAPYIDGDATTVLAMITAATTRYRLSNLGADAYHQFGWVLGEFLELVVINRTSSELILVVASRD
jgi:hypothetical protein